MEAVDKFSLVLHSDIRNAEGYSYPPVLGSILTGFFGFAGFCFFGIPIVCCIGDESW